MDYQEKIEKLRKYLIKMDRLQRKCGEAALWDSMAEGKRGGVAEAGARWQNPDTIKETAIQIRQESEALAASAAELRGELVGALEQMETAEYRDILERKYIEGKSNDQLSAEYGYSVRTIRRRIAAAILELERDSGFFS